jgi:hypothetical protein
MDYENDCELDALEKKDQLVRECDYEYHAHRLFFLKDKGAWMSFQRMRPAGCYRNIEAWIDTWNEERQAKREELEDRSEKNTYWNVEWEKDDPEDGVYEWFNSHEYFIFDFEEN